MHYKYWRSFYSITWVVLLSLIGSFLSLSLFAASPYTTKELDSLEREFVQLINQSHLIERNPLANEYINHLGKSLTQSEEMESPYFFIVKSNEVNAFAGPGGYIGVNTQLILTSDNESELAAVMAHEIAHTRLHHLYRMLEHQKLMQVPKLASILASLALGMINPALGNGALMATMGGFAQDNINFTRANEKEADRIGMDMLVKGGFDPAAMSQFFKKMQQNTRYYYTSHVPAILRTHPLDAERIAEAENRTAQMKSITHHSSIQYKLFKELIRVSVTEDSKRLFEYYRFQNKQDPVIQYGYALASLRNNQHAEAIHHLTLLIEKDPHNLFFELALAEAKIADNKVEEGLTILKELHHNYPENYAVTINYAEGLMASSQASQAARLLLKASRLFKNDLSLCYMLAQAQADAKQKQYAYFTYAQCQLLQGRKKDAIRQLKLAQSLANKDYYLKARISALLEELAS